MIQRTETWLRAVAFPGAWLASLLFHDRLLALPTSPVEDLPAWSAMCGMGRALVAAFAETPLARGTSTGWSSSYLASRSCASNQCGA
jgi:hypothetical protein